MIKEIDFLTKDECEKWAQKVKDLADQFTDRKIFWTLGASAYLDHGENYANLSYLKNPVLWSNFRMLYVELVAQLQIELNLNHYPEMGKYAMPGFHIFNKRYNGVQASIHVDKPWDGLFEPDSIEETFSFTVPLDIPSCGAGLNWWDEDNIKHKREYELGNIYLHWYGLIHQINNDCEMKTGENRITLQGHGAKIDGQWVVYF